MLGVSPFQLEINNQLKFKFLSIFKWEERKGWKILVRAFVEEFKKSENFGLFLLTHGYHLSDENGPKKQLKDFVSLIMKEKNIDESDIPYIKILDLHIPQHQLPNLYQAADCVVIPSRGEGWGRPHVEALSMEKPLIATFWSGPTEFMTPENSYPLRTEPQLVEITEGAFQGHKWAEPNLVHLKELMRDVVNDPHVAKQVQAPFFIFLRELLNKF
eukprot:TRINITY_DN3997_c0_g3_i6.p1 TRINITY_DN3997_c0_g3~~TRINITY_DN3997_c0_g3_i6.p1  ORF type:complete len:215 (+),score=44.27 TRINITY_DN3997_c0_g3_i6:832-1476(+)